jgi:NADPH-dependent curcumin reductase CurA
MTGINRQVRLRSRPEGISPAGPFEIVEVPLAPLAAGRLTHREDILEGLEAAPDAIAGLYRGESLGKRVIRQGPAG